MINCYGCIYDLLNPIALSYEYRIELLHLKIKLQIYKINY